VVVLKPFFSKVGAAFQLTKILLCLPIGCAAGFGYVLHKPVLEWALLWSCLGVFWLACGGAAVNSLQEIETDRQYARTCRRPLVTGKLQPWEARLLGFFCILPGIGGLWWGAGGIVPPLLGLLALGSYNLVYTPLKQSSPFALLPGAVAGALPPVIGWTAAGGSFLSLGSWLLFALYFLWQIPHFFLIFFRHQEDYQQVGYPSLIQHLSSEGCTRIFFVWIAALITAVLAFIVEMPQLKFTSKIILLGFCAGLVFLGVFAWMVRRESGGIGRGLTVFNASFFLSISLVMALQLY